MVTELLRMHQSTMLQGQTVGPHLHHFHQLDVMYTGGLLTMIEGRRPFLVQAGEALLIPPLVRHSFRSLENVRHAGFKFHVAPAFWPVFGVKARCLRLPPRVLEEVRAWGVQFGRRSPLHSQLAVAVVTICLVEIAQAFPERSVRVDGFDTFRSRLWKLLEQIGRDPYAKWSIAALADQAHLSRPHFSRCFHKVFGRTPKRYLLEERLRAAAAELAGQPAHPIKEIAEHAGYGTVHAFTQAFKRLFGVSPGAYRRRPPRL